MKTVQLRIIARVQSTFAVANVRLPSWWTNESSAIARAEARGLDAQAEVVVLEVAGAEALLEPADAVERVAAREQAEADDARHRRGRAAVRGRALGGEGVEPGGSAYGSP